MQGRVLLLCTRITSSKSPRFLTFKPRASFSIPSNHFSTSRITVDGVELEYTDEEGAFDAFNQYLSDEQTTDSPSSSTLQAVLSDRRVFKAPNVLRGVANSYLRLSETHKDLGLRILDVDVEANALTKTQASALCDRLLESPLGLTEVNINTLLYVTHILSSSKSTKTEVLGALVNELLRRWSEEPGVGMEGHFRGAWALFCLLRALIRMDSPDATLHFQNVLRSRHWWPAGAMDVPDSISDPRIIGLIFILRCCISWRWWERAYLVGAELLKQVDDKREPTEALHRILHELIDAHITATGIEFDVRLASSLLCAIADHPALPPIHDRLLSRFYRAAAEQNNPRMEIVSNVYLYLRDKALVFDPHSSNQHGIDNDMTARSQSKAPHAYLPPRGKTMHMLMQYYQRTNDQNAARMLIQDVQKKLEFLPSNSLRLYLSFLIRMSFATEARHVVEYCWKSSDLELRGIVRVPAIARALVSLFVSSADAAHRRSLKRAGSEAAAVERLRSQELLAFARRVLMKYRKTPASLGRWSHHNLTTLARMAFEVGYFGIGFRALEVIRDLPDPDIFPDDHDFHVLLHTLATGDLRAAYDLLEYMISRDVEPDRATYSAVTTQAIKQGDFELAQKIMSKAESRGRLPNDPQLLGAICWHTISRENLQGRSRREVRKRLSDVLKLLGPISPSTETIFRERTFGIRAAYAALRSKNPELAYAFWKRCVRYKSIMKQPDDPVTTLAEDSEKRLRMEIFEALEKTESDSFSKREKDLLLRPPEVRPVTWRRSSSILP